MSNATSFGAGEPPGTAGGMMSSPAIGRFGYGVGVSAGILVLITTLMLASYFCTRAAQQPPDPPPPPGRRRDGSGDVEAAAGLDEATLAAYPKLLYSQARKARRGAEESTAASCCSICLADYKGPDVLRRLPECGHLFHLGCVDPWLRLHPTCPVCRTSPLPSPLPTPLSELVPLARAASRGV